MLILFTILAGITALSLLVAKIVRRDVRLSENTPPKFQNPDGLRPLFQPTDDDIRAFEREEEALLDAKKAAESRRLMKEKSDRFEEFKKQVIAAPDRKDIIEMLVRAVEFNDASVYAATSREIIELARAERIENLTSSDVTELLESHISLLSQQERAAGDIFRLREEIGELRRRTEEIA